jgi:hypothetical protein
VGKAEDGRGDGDEEGGREVVCGRWQERGVLWVEEEQDRRLA